MKIHWDYMYAISAFKNEVLKEAERVLKIETDETKSEDERMKEIQRVEASGVTGWDCGWTYIRIGYDDYSIGFPVQSVTVKEAVAYVYKDYLTEKGYEVTVFSRLD